jgi:hypothetical protein
MRRHLSLFLAIIVLACTPLSFAESTLLISNVRRIYIEKMPDNLDQYLASSISKKFHGSVTVVLNRGEADAIMKGINIGAQTSTQATVQVVDPAERQVLWSGTAGDRSWMTLEVTHGGREKVADHLIGELKKAMQR